MGTLTEVGSNFLLFFLVFGMSATVDIDKLRKQLRNKHALMTGVAMQFLILPFVGFCVVKVFGYSAPVGITLLVVTSSPGGSYSNWWCSLFNAELALSVTMTALSTMVSVVMLPVNLIIYASGSYSSAVVKSLDWYALFMSIFVVIGGISSGLFCSSYFKDSPPKANRIRKAANRFGNASGMALISYSILVSSSDHKAALWDQSWDFFVGLAIPAVVGITTATLLATRFNLDKPERVAVAVESCYQNTGIATSVAAVMFDDTEDDLATAISVPLYYGLVEMVLLATFCLLSWKAGWTKAPSDEKLCVVLATSYEVELGEEGAEGGGLEVVMGGVVRSEDEGDCEKGKGGSPRKAKIVFEASEVTADDESQASGAVVLRKVDTSETVSTNGSDSSSPPREAEEKTRVVLDNTPSIRPLPLTPSGSMFDEIEGEEQGLGGKEAGKVGRFGKTISFVKARATGYRRATVVNGDGDDEIISPSRREPETVIPASGELADLEDCRQRSRSRTQSLSPEASPKTTDQTPIECPPLPLTPSGSQEEADATPAEGKTID